MLRSTHPAGDGAGGDGSTSDGSAGHGARGPIMPDLSVLLPDTNDIMRVAPALSQYELGDPSSADNHVEDYGDTDLDEMTRRQMEEDIAAYRYDIMFCREHLTSADDLTPQESRTLQIRIMDCGHNVRHCIHRIQRLDAAARQGSDGGSGVSAPTHTAKLQRSGSSRATNGGAAAVSHKRRKTKAGNAVLNEATEVGPSGLAYFSPYERRQSTAKANNGPSHNGDETGDRVTEAGADDTADSGSIVVKTPAFAPQGSNGRKRSFDKRDDGEQDDTTDVGTPGPSAVQRLGFWQCRLCIAQKYLDAGAGRVPSAPSKWPIKDISKMLNHFLDMHTEHTPHERCAELGDALAKNKGPFEYWLTFTKSQELEDISAIDEYVETLQSGTLPEVLRPLNRAAGVFPNSNSNSAAYNH